MQDFHQFIFNMTLKKLNKVLNNFKTATSVADKDIGLLT